VVVRQDGVEWQIALGDAGADYTFRVEVTSPPVEGEVEVEARFVPQLIASTKVTLPALEHPVSSSTIATFGEQSTNKTDPLSSSEDPTDAAPTNTSRNGSGGVGPYLGAAGLRFFAGSLLTAVAFAVGRRNTAGTR